MSFLIFLHYMFVFILFLLGIFVYKKYKNSSWIFFLLFCVFYSIWYFCYTIVYSDYFSDNTILIIIRLMYVLSLIWSYSMLFFVKYFSVKKSILKEKQKIIFSIYTMIFIWVIWSGFFIETVTHNSDNNYYLESYWVLYPLLAFWYLLFLPLFIWTYLKKIKQLRLINKMRMKYICIWFIITSFLSELFLVIFPLFWKFYFVESIILFLIPFLIFTFYSIYTFHFTNLKVQIWKIFILILSLFWSILILNIIKEFYVSLWNNFWKLWWINQSYEIVDLIWLIALFLWFKTLFTKLFLWNIQINIFEKKLEKIKKRISFITDIQDLNQYLQYEFQKLFKISYIKIENNLWNLNKQSELYNYLNSSLDNNYFINDLVFIEENKHKFQNSKLQKEINTNIYLIFPLYNKKNEIISYLYLWKKPFQDTYYRDDINILKDFCNFLEWHLQYLKTYQHAYDLSINLDKKVDEQTIEYNQLINKQTEFISYVSHEIKGPIGSSIFQADSIIDELEEGEMSKKSLLIEIKILNNLLLKTWDLVNKLFSIQQLELNSHSLFKQEIKILDLLQTEIDTFQLLHSNIQFNTFFELSQPYCKLDKVQCKQVIDNLINNAIKVVDSNSWIINISCIEVKNNIVIEIEDNGPGFTDLDIQKIFNKYTTWKSSTVGLWMGLYLCKTIVELHKWTIQAAFGTVLWWAKIIIKIPII